MILTVLLLSPYASCFQRPYRLRCDMSQGELLFADWLPTVAAWPGLSIASVAAEWRWDGGGRCSIDSSMLLPNQPRSRCLLSTLSSNRRDSTQLKMEKRQRQCDAARANLVSHSHIPRSDCLSPKQQAETPTNTLQYPHLS